MLKTGLFVPCGKCVLCLSHRRDEWSHRLQLHSYGYDQMPLFVGLTYEDENLRYGVESPTLLKADLQLFIKRLKENYGLYDTDFSYFACGEYGDKYNRPHYHVLFFGFNTLSDLLDKNWLKAHQDLRQVWKLGNVDIGRAEWSGVHYVTKYVLKYDGTDYQGVEKPFMMCSNGIGLPWLNTPECKYLVRRLRDVFSDRKALRIPELDFSSYEDFVKTCRDGLHELESQLPRLVAHTPQGIEVPLPRYLRQKLLGSFEVFKDSPYWYLEYFRKVVDSDHYVREYQERDLETDVPRFQQLLDIAKRRIRQRVYLNSKDFRNETIRIGSNQKTCL